MTKVPTIARIWRGRTKPEFADEYEAYNRAEGIPPLLKTAIGVNCCAKIERMKHGSRRSPTGPTWNR